MKQSTTGHSPFDFTFGGLDAPKANRGKIALRCVAALVGVTLFGTIGFFAIEPDWDLWQSLYFTLITITTVGYGDEGLSADGRKFATVLLLAGIGTATYSLSILVQVAVSYQLCWRRRMQQHIDRFHDHIVVCGFGRMGKTICELLAGSGVQFLVVERDETEYQDAIDRGYPAIHGNATEDEVLHKAGVDRCRGVVCVIDSDANNVFITLSARDLNSDAFIACRADTEGAVSKVQRAGASLVVSPHYSAGVDIATAILRPHLAEFLRCGRSASADFELGEVTIEKGSPVVGQTVSEFGGSEEAVVFVAMKRPGGETIVRPGGNVAFQTGDVVIVAGSPKDLARVYQHACAC